MFSLPVISVVPIITFFTVHPIFAFPQQVPTRWDDQTFILEDLSIVRPAASDCGEFMTVITVPGRIRGSRESIHTPDHPNSVVDTQVPRDSHHESQQPVSPTLPGASLQEGARKGHGALSASSTVQSSRAQNSRYEKGTFCWWLIGDKSKCCHSHFHPDS